MHAAGESSPGNLPPDTHAIVLAVENEDQLLKLEDRLKRHDIPHKAIREPDYDGALMAIGIVPMPRDIVRKHVGSIGLLGGKNDPQT